MSARTGRRALRGGARPVWHHTEADSSLQRGHQTRSQMGTAFSGCRPGPRSNRKTEIEIRSKPQPTSAPRGAPGPSALVKSLAAASFALLRFIVVKTFYSYLVAHVDCRLPDFKFITLTLQQLQDVPGYGSPRLVHTYPTENNFKRTRVLFRIYPRARFTSQEDHKWAKTSSVVQQ
ncbi:hypothetical protein NDU88_006468 [Pleurodeles waltl]|uniref:Uncharacterized protein n=1 Tax=Pleurodeles waltl TaxID=8319 RepID=A0AAV7SPQ3_PLEWA|nr:hypothetical protein NDU88_006468 [Pleurodeles waltl]